MLETFSAFISQFHFTQPLWLAASIPLLVIYILIRQKKTSKSGWSKVIDAHLLPVLIKNNQGKTGKSFSMLLMIGWIISVIALANPVWEKRIMPVFQTNTARVIVLDLSRSMEIQDIKPSRLARARFKIEDILAKDEEGQTGLVVFAGDAFTVTPLTRDADTIRSLLKSLTPSIMPIQGSRADLGLLKAGELLEQAGVPRAQIILMADGAESGKALDAAKKLKQKGYSISVLSIGTKAGAPIPKVRNRDGKPIIVGMEEDVLKEIADMGGGYYHPLSSDSTDIDSLLSLSKLKDSHATEKSNDQQSKDWKSEGPWFVLLLLPLAALAFRRGWLLSVALVVVVFAQPQPVFASVWDSLWKRQDQQADMAFQAGNYEQAQQLAEDPLRKGSAAYKKGDFKQALTDFSQVQDADGLYNKGNALARLEQYKEAIQAYNQALKQQPGMRDAKKNKAKIEELLKKQEAQQNKQQNNKDQKNKDKDNKDKKNNKSQKDKQQSNDQKNEQESSDSSEKDKENKQSEENQFAKANDQDKEDEKEKGERENNKEDRENGEGQQQAQAEEKNDNEAEKEKQPKMAKADEDKEGGKDEESKAAKAKANAESLTNEEKIAAEQWLRRIPDDPGGLLKRKFKYQYKRRGQRAGTGGEQPW